MQEGTGYTSVFRVSVSLAKYPDRDAPRTVTGLSWCGGGGGRRKEEEEKEEEEEEKKEGEEEEEEKEMDFTDYRLSSLRKLGELQRRGACGNGSRREAGRPAQADVPRRAQGSSPHQFSSSSSSSSSLPA